MQDPANYGEAFYQHFPKACIAQEEATSDPTLFDPAFSLLGEVPFYSFIASRSVPAAFCVWNKDLLAVGGTPRSLRLHRPYWDRCKEVCSKFVLVYDWSVAKEPGLIGEAKSVGSDDSCRLSSGNIAGTHYTTKVMTFNLDTRLPTQFYNVYD